MVFSLIKRLTSGNQPTAQQQLLDIAESFNLWDILKSKYMTIERIQIWQNFTHDIELKALLKLYVQDLFSDKKLLEKELSKFAMKTPDNHIVGLQSSVNPDMIRDQFIANDIFLYLQEDIETLLRSFRSSTTNEQVRSLLLRMTQESIERLDGIVKYLRLKGWIEVPPLYPHIPKNVTEKIDNSEAYHLWDHLTFRYDNVRQTDIYTRFANDYEFKWIINKGAKVLRKQIKILEQEHMYFGIPLPVRPPAVPPTPETTEDLNDDHMFRIIFLGIQGATIMHAMALKQCTTNDRIRQLFKKLLMEEIQIQENLIKFGKLKGWFHPVPSFRL